MKTIITFDTFFFLGGGVIKTILSFHMSFFWLVPFGDRFYMTSMCMATCILIFIFPSSRIRKPA